MTTEELKVPINACFKNAIIFDRKRISSIDKKGLNDSSSEYLSLPVDLPFDSLDSLDSDDEQEGFDDCETKRTCSVSSRSSDDRNDCDDDEFEKEKDENCAFSLSSFRSMASHSWYLLLSYPHFRCYFLVCLLESFSGSLVEIARWILLQQVAIGNDGLATAHFILCELIPKSICAPIGGYLADRFDRRLLIITIDSTASLVVLGNLCALHFESLALLYLTKIVQNILNAVSYPTENAFIPLLVPDKQDLQYATTLLENSSTIACIVSGFVAGSAAQLIGFQTFFILDCFVKIIGTLVIKSFIVGNYNVSTFISSTDTQRKSFATTGQNAKELETEPGNGPASPQILVPKELGNSEKGSTQNVFCYLATCGFGLLVFMKGTGSLIWGPGDVIGFELAQVYLSDGITADEVASSYRIGIWRSAINIGWLLGTVLINVISDARYPSTVQRSCLVSLCFSTVGWLLIAQAINSDSFHCFLLGTVVRVIGSGIMSTSSTMLLQTLCNHEMMGRILSIEFLIFGLLEAVTTSTSGQLLDKGVAKSSVAWLGVFLGAIATMFWGTYHFNGHGAANECFNTNKTVHSPVTRRIPGQFPILVHGIAH